MVGARLLATSVCSQCVVCRKAAAKTESWRMGQLPTARVNPAPPFYTTGIDYAGPFILKRGHTRKPVLMKAYVAVFICFTTKAAHLELISDLTTEAFLAALRRFEVYQHTFTLTTAQTLSEPEMILWSFRCYSPITRFR